MVRRARLGLNPENCYFSVSESSSSHGTIGGSIPVLRSMIRPMIRRIGIGPPSPFVNNGVNKKAIMGN